MKFIKKFRGEKIYCDYLLLSFVISTFKLPTMYIIFKYSCTFLSIYYEGNIIEVMPCKFINPYSYDVHGNVATLLQDNPTLASIKQRFKRIDYDYDLISNKMNDVYYQHDSAK